ncbi:TorD/DmsD family molecular chaperone [Vibrio renipiscarius]|uniref:Cytochrome C oxidase subunit II n=1 Tax=Vibrio renipiscarius TaxID=1461322 RepID=A0A0C2JSJ4_9VIBR|nr:molecular chaperone TorD family protein [Vibrio renipiscarius]KII79353.1 cytochrome C oxidase subunit II [Vibrio renipiscarius]KII81019.1 cytochrome C oxidase subunit II [Vibrio renipiscarius]
MENFNEQQSLRSDIYLLIAALFRQAPSAALIDFLSTLDVEASESAMQKAWFGLKEAAQNSDREALEDEYQNLFIGIGRGEAVLFGSWHMTGSLMEKPLADIRHDLERLGFEREAQVKEPEDHISALCEVMAMLTEEDAEIQQAFFNKHLATWYDAFAQQVETAKSADFYRSAAALLLAFGTLEQVQFSKNTKSKTHLKIDVKNVTEYE